MINAKDYLNKLRYIEMDVRSRMDEITKLEASLTPSPSNLKPLDVKGGMNKEITEVYNLIIEHKQYLSDKILELIALKRDTSLLIDKIEDAQSRAILRDRYVNFKTWEVIQAETHYGDRQLRRIHQNALCKFEDILKDVRKCP